MKTLFKIVRKIEGGGYGSILDEEYNPYCIKYALGEKIVAPGDSLLFCFDDLERVKAYYLEFTDICYNFRMETDDYVILLCSTEDELKPLNYRLFLYLEKNFDNFWKDFPNNILDFSIVDESPTGTMGVKSLTPIRELKYNENFI